MQDEVSYPNPAELFAQTHKPAPRDLPLDKVKTPCYLMDMRALEDNARHLAEVAKLAGCKILLAEKAFSFFHSYGMLSQYFEGVSASGIYEARLGFDFLPEGKEVHSYSPAFTEHEFPEIMQTSSHVVFNSFRQWQRFQPFIKGKDKRISAGLRLNPEYSEVDNALYNPAAPHSRLGITLKEFEKGVALYGLTGIDGFHVHTLCEENSSALVNMVEVLIAKFGPYLKQAKWINLGGGHHITRADYDTAGLVRAVAHLREYSGAEIYLEPGEAWALDSGWLVSEIIEEEYNEMALVLLDTSATCHMPDVLEMPYRPRAFLISGEDGVWYDGALPGEKVYTVRAGGPTCLAGDIIGDWSFDKNPVRGDRMVFCDMAIYTMVKNNTFNGMPLPDIVISSGDGQYKVVRTFSYDDFKSRLG